MTPKGSKKNVPAQDADDDVDEDRQEAGDGNQRSLPAADTGDVKGDRIGDSRALRCVVQMPTRIELAVICK